MRRIGLGLTCLLAAALAHAEPALEIAGTATDEQSLTIDWFLGGAAGRPKAAQVLVDGRPIDTARVQLPPDEDLPLTYLFLVDTSESMGKALEKSVQPFLQAVVTARPERHYYGVGRFDSSLKMLAEPTRDDAKLAAALKDIKLHGSRTELYRSLIEGTKKLRDSPGYRKVMVVISDGGAEDVAYKLEDAVAAAKDAHIAIVTIGYFDSINLQNLAKLSEKTGGGHLPLARADTPLLYGEAKTIFQKTDTGGRVRIPFEALPEHASGARQLTLRVTAADDSVLEQVVQVELPQVSSQILSGLARYVPWLPPRASLWIAIFALCALLLLGLLALMSRRQKAAAPAFAPAASPGAGATVREGRPAAAATVAAQRAPDMATVRATPGTVAAATHAGGRAIALIQHATGSLDITTLPCTIGALRDNALQINDESVSRYHAVLDRKDGRFFITDRGSANGTYVNRNKTQHAEIKNGDQLRFGTWEGIFRVLE
jgi:hypothetical protein